MLLENKDILTWIFLFSCPLVNLWEKIPIIGIVSRLESFVPDSSEEKKPGIISAHQYCVDVPKGQRKGTLLSL